MNKFPPSKILVPFDFSELSDHAWRLAESFSKRFGARAEALYVEDLLPTPAWEFYKTHLTPEVRRGIREHLLSKLGADAKVLMEEGDPVVNILRMARIRKPDLLIMGTHGRTGLNRVWMGSTTEAVVRLSPVPVLTLRDKTRPIRGVLAPVKFTDYAETGLGYAARAAASLGAQLTVLHVVADPTLCTNPEYRLNNMISRLPEETAKACRPQVRVTEGGPTEKILEAAKGCDLIVLMAHRKSILRDMVLGTTAERVVRLSETPVLAVPTPRTAPARPPKRKFAREFVPPLI